MAGSIPPSAPFEDAPTLRRAEVERAVDALVDERRTRCLWYLRPDQHAGKCVLDPEGALQRAAPAALAAEVAADRVRYREGSIRGVLPELIGAPRPAAR